MRRSIAALAVVNSLVGSLCVLCCSPDGALAAEERGQQSGALVIVTKATSACFSDMVRVTGFLVPRREMQVGVDQEGFRVNDVLVKEGDKVTDNQEVIRLQPPPGAGGAPGAGAAPAGAGGASATPGSPGVNLAAAGGRSSLTSLRAPAAGTVIQISARPGAIASPQLGPLMRITADDQIELDAEVPGLHMLKLNPGATARITVENGPELGGRVRLVAPVIDPRTQLGHVRIAVFKDPSIKIGMFARATIDAARSCGVSIPRLAVDHQTVQVVRDNVVEVRRVQTGLVSDTSVEIRVGVKEGEIVVANAGTSLHDGDRIRTMFADEVDRLRDK
jgi:multidrug efflux pump subunit AcrA (membrane-fusion protein)